MTPAPMHTMLVKQTKEEAIAKMEMCKEAVTVNVLPTAQDELKHTKS